MAAFERLVPGAATMGPADWARAREELRLHGRPLRDWTLEEALASVLSEEGHQYVLDGFGYATLLAGRNAAEAIPWILIETRPEAENRTLADGMERLPRALAENLPEPVVCGREAVAVVPRADGELEVSFAEGGPTTARRVILALPARPLRRLLAEPHRALLAGVTAHAASKLFLDFADAWWRAPGFSGLRAVSDLPLSKTYYFDRPDPAGPSTGGLLLAAYGDGGNRDHWAELAAPPTRLDDLAYGDTGRWGAYAASAGQVEEACRHLALLHDTAVPAPEASAFVDWGDDGAWHVWDPGVDPVGVMDRLTRPDPEIPLYTCGEACSLSQGWVEGALESTERALERLLA